MRLMLDTLQNAACSARDTKVICNAHCFNIIWQECKALHCDRCLATLEGAGLVLKSLEHGVDLILHDTAHGTLFLAGDSGQTMSLPSGFSLLRVFSRYSEVGSRYRDAMRGCVRNEGWPPPVSALRTRLVLSGQHTCSLCGHGFNKNWLQRGVCWNCEQTIREKGRCPYVDTHACMYCPHSQKCLVCDVWTCGECCLTHGDGEVVAGLVDACGAHAVWIAVLSLALSPPLSTSLMDTILSNCSLPLVPGFLGF